MYVLSITFPMYSATILNRIPLADNMILLELEKPEGFTFTAGQFVQFLTPQPEGKVKKTAYSIASAPDDPTLQFVIKVYDDGITSQSLMADDVIGTSVELSEVKGRFGVSGDSDSDLFVATGTGIAPIMSMIRDELLHKNTAKDMILFFGVRHMTDLFWKEELEALAEEYDNFSCNITLSQPEDVWDGIRGRVTHHIETHHAKHHAYLCGSAPMVMEVRKLLLSHGAEATQLHFEIF